MCDVISFYTNGSQVMSISVCCPQKSNSCFTFNTKKPRLAIIGNKLWICTLLVSLCFFHSIIPLDSEPGLRKLNVCAQNSKWLISDICNSSEHWDYAREGWKGEVADRDVLWLLLRSPAHVLSADWFDGLAARCILLLTNLELTYLCSASRICFVGHLLACSRLV